jgi:hypothetical protein
MAGGGMMDASYHAQAGCHNCRHAFIKKEYDAPHRYYCNRIKTRRPRCGSVYMKEIVPMYPWYNHDERSEVAWDKWSAWSEPRAVAPWGVCKYHKLKKEVE